MKVLHAFKSLNDGFFRAAALRDARLRVVSSDGREPALRQATLLIEVARRTADPVEPLPPASSGAVLVVLYREAIRWGLVAGLTEPGAPASDLRALWNASMPEALAAAAPDATTLEAIKAVVVDGERTASLEVADEDVARLRAFAEALVANLDAPRRVAERIRGQRWMRIVLTALVVLLVGYGLRRATLGPNLAADKSWRTSSTWAGCPTDPNCVGLAFCTDSQADPWAELDLGAVKSFNRIEVTNRGDCCGDRAVPLIIEVSSDRVTWAEVARRDAEFSSWTAKFKRRSARYVKFRVPRTTVFHLQEVAIR